MAAQVGFAAVAFILGKIAQQLLKKDSKAPLDQVRGTAASKGSFIPLLVGCRAIGPTVLCQPFNRTVTTEGHAGGKGVTGGGTQQLVYREDRADGICIGPARKLHRIRENDKIIWEGPITPESHPSGSTITVSGHGAFRIYWGEGDQPIDDHLEQEVGYGSRRPFMCWALWIQKRLGGSAVWGSLDYEIEVHPYKKGDTYAYNGPYEGINGLPERLEDSIGWFKNGTGPFGIPEPILRATDGANGVLKLAGNVVPFGTPPPMCDIEGNSVQADGRYDILSITYNASEQIREPSGVFVEVAGASGNASADWVPDGSIASIAVDPFGTPPPGATRGGSYVENSVYKVNLDQPFSGWRDLTETIVTGASEQFLSPGVNHIRVFFRAFGQSNFSKIRIKLMGYDHPSLSDEEADIEIEYLPGGTTTIVGSNGGFGTIENVGIAPGGGSGVFFEWWQVDFYYQSNTGSQPFNQDWKRKIQVSIMADDAAFVTLYVNDGDLQPGALDLFETAFLSDDDGTLVTGITTVTLSDPDLFGSNYTGGTCQFLKLNSGADGANIAHTVDQFLFETEPHGKGFSRKFFDIDSLEALGVALGVDGEGLRTHVLVENGETLEATMANIMLDAGFMVSWDPTIGKFVFVLVRDPQADPIETIPQEAIASPLPSIKTILEATSVDRKVYLFKDREFNYHDVPLNMDDDGRASREQNQNAKSERLFIVTDLEAAADVVSRREQLDLNPPTAYTIHALRAARRLVPGRPLLVNGIEERLRIMEVGPVDAKSSKVKIQALTDLYGAPPPSTS